MSRWAFKAEVDHAAALALRHHHDLSVVAFDLDHFKSINDTYGHPAGDAVLKKTVASCSGQLQNTDLIGRMGGEEFTVLLPNTNQTSALQVTEKIRAAVERIVFQDKVIKLTASLGVASLDYNVI
jgi:diguanylate cyclase (GGDEF)-like protein